MSPPRYQLVSADGRGLIVGVGQSEVTVGRSTTNVLALDDDAASRVHCVLRVIDNGQLMVQDLGSRNGVKINGRRPGVERAPLVPGDTLKIGNHTFRVELDTAPVPEPTPGRTRPAIAGTSVEHASDEPWAAELFAQLRGIPPKQIEHDPVTLHDASGEASAALSNNGPGPLCVRLLLVLASKSRATDVHIEPKSDQTQVRLRVDGQMVPVVDLPAKVGELALGLVRTACLLRPVADGAVQDGHFSVRMGARRVDYRVSITPSVHGPKLVLRVLDPQLTPTSLSELGMSAYMDQRLRQACDKEQGFILVCGPTGSGKTTTIYSALREIDRRSCNVVTIEDPVEYQIDHVTQIPTDERAGNTFNTLLRSVLRQDPDVILVGEIRDEETARTALQAAMTGHLVFSTVHSKDSISAVFRLLDLKAEPYLIAQSLDVVVAQRLVRVLCDNCKTPVRVRPGEASRIGRFLEGKHETFTHVGCAQCLRTGYRGRRAIFEMLDFTDELRDVILRDPNISAIKKIIEHSHFTTLVQAGWQLAARGSTSLEEVHRVCGSGA